MQTTLIVIEAGRSERHYWLDLWRYRELFAVLAWRDLSVRYKQTVIGVLWALIRPVLTMVVLTVVFGRIAALPSDGTTPYALMVFAGMDRLAPRTNGRSHSDLISFVTDRPGHDFRYAINFSKISAELGWAPKNSFESGLASTVKWYVENRAWWGPLVETRSATDRRGLSKKAK